MKEDQLKKDWEEFNAWKSEPFDWNKPVYPEENVIKIVEMERAKDKERLLEEVEKMYKRLQPLDKSDFVLGQQIATNDIKQWITKHYDE